MTVAQTGTSFPPNRSENSSKHAKERWKDELDPQDEDKAEKPVEEQLADANLPGRSTFITIYGVGSFHAFYIQILPRG
jgi:hypothetical protein